MATAQDERLEKVVSADGTPIAVWATGEGPPLVLVHGTAADHSRWVPVLPVLGERFTVLAVDRAAAAGAAMPATTRSSVSSRTWPRSSSGRAKT